ncbi:MAG: SMC-Scp complex subunit ScpB [Candidatus Abyssobacteria bacterium SURF_17]|uniref:SMC-Scp complex subunit ScpB n=1 Tax=Candidatus Abyssobacteria bacterium SURF_17 TaxID=2093361 RepID=A0A419F9J8_9BACT|nr:MAG: SMC-Scp complex subunit ScpB [Candidatus Abyssubacteria bacterium SURF_17]
MEEYEGITDPVQQEPGNETGAESPESTQSDMDAPSIEEGAEQTPNGSDLPDEELRSIVEVLLLVSDKPLSVSRIREVLDGPAPKKIEEIVAQVQQRLSEYGFPFQVREVAGGYVLSTLPKYAPWVQKFYSPRIRASRLSQAALETLAVIAYKQPVTRAEIEAIRGVNVDSTLRTLLEKRLVEIVGYKDVIGKPATYGTTTEFLLHFGLKALSDLPSVEELRRAGSDA